MIPLKNGVPHLDRSDAKHHEDKVSIDKGFKPLVSLKASFTHLVLVPSMTAVKVTTRFKVNSHVTETVA